MPTTTVDVTDLGFEVDPGADRTATIDVGRAGVDWRSRRREFSPRYQPW
ncbi:hypothetical protein GJ633_07125 [Halorubrum sp. CBA1125]|jgi:hypothetical protein|nr:hypothetical protein [Halorubrum sp. CBA1125]MUW14466.1 hypothetical protein [Halorubrum sp. CBA1125]